MSHCGDHHNTGNCVCDILREIVDAQRDVVSSECTTSCEISINDLLGDVGAGPGKDTVPVILYCEGNCKPFKGFGALPGDIGNVQSSFFFRAKSVDEDCCATVELLRDPTDSCMNPDDPTEQKTDNLEATGICITVDLNCFCHVTCLPAISALQ